ncbi:MAG: haloalkane dehalogenase [Sneathiellales bacterium]|nr:haloalkane dehalogenase [Sneathiellales bacterium]
MEALRTPDERFENLDGYAYSPNYLEIEDTEGGSLRLHYVDEGPKDGEIVLLMHGEPSWSYLYRTMIPVLNKAGYRTIAPDLIGFGRSDKPSKRSDYTYARHVAWMLEAFDQLKLDNVTLFCQDWGGLIGLRLVAARPDKFARVVAGNTFLPTGDQTPSDAFFKWQSFSQSVPEFPAGGIIKGATVLPMSDAAIAGYDAPYPDESYKEGARQFPMLVPSSPDNPESQPNREAWEILKKWDKPFLTTFSDSDPVTKGGDKVLQKLIPGTQGQAHVTIEQGGHFLQEDQGPKIAEVMINFMEKNPLS